MGDENVPHVFQRRGCAACNNSSDGYTHFHRDSRHASNKMYSTSSLIASVASAACAGSILGLVVGITFMSTCAKDSSRHSMRRRLSWWLSRKKKKSFPKRLILVRHGESEGNVDPELYGRVPDNAMHLTQLGYEQALAAGRSIKKLVKNETMVRCRGCLHASLDGTECY